MAILAEFHVISFMANGSSDSTMNVLIWGVVLLGGIGVFVVWGLANAYPVSP